MKRTEGSNCHFSEYLSPLKLTLLALNGISFGGLLVLVLLGRATPPVVFLTISTGVSLTALLIGTLLASRNRIRS